MTTHMTPQGHPWICVDCGTGLPHWDSFAVGEVEVVCPVCSCVQAIPTGLQKVDELARAAFFSRVVSAADELAVAMPLALAILDIRCCGQPARLVGNLSLREAGAENTTLAYECEVCRQRFSVVDEWAAPPTAMLVAQQDEVE